MMRDTRIQQWDESPKRRPMGHARVAMFLDLGLVLEFLWGNSPRKV